MARSSQQPLWDLSCPDMPPCDENGVDLEQIKSLQSLTPCERLEQMQGWADFLFNIWKDRGFDWLDIERSSNV
jgi:hypothetical protein